MIEIGEKIKIKAKNYIIFINALIEPSTFECEKREEKQHLCRTQSKVLNYMRAVGGIQQQQ